MAKFRIGIIGAGSRGIQSFGGLLTANHKDACEVVAFADPNRERAEAGVRYLGVEADIHADYHDLVRRKDIEAVVVTTPDYLHEKACVAAFRHRKHVLVDKPLATTGKGCLRVIQASRKAGKLLYMGFNLRQDIVVRKLRKLIAGGTFGDVFSLHAVEHYDGGRTYMSRWNRLKKFSGGLWIHKGSHDFDVLNWFMGNVHPYRVSCFANVSVFKPEGLPFKVRKGVKPGPRCSVCKYADQCPDKFDLTPAGSPVETVRAEMWSEKAAKVDSYHKDLCMYLSDKDTHDQGIAMIEYENGATACHAEYFATPFTNRRYVIEGTLGHGEGDVHGNRVEILPRWTDDRVVHHLQRAGGGHGGTDPLMVAEFVECLQKGRRPTASGIDGAWSVAIGEACEIARAEARVVKISEVLDTRSSLLKPARRGKR